MTAILKVWRRVENRTPSIDVYLFTLRTLYQISSRSDWKRGALGFLDEVEELSPEQEQQDE